MTGQGGRTTIFIDPDGTLDFGLLLLVRATTGVHYLSQSGGVLTLDRRAEGFLIPVGSPKDALPLRESFNTFQGNPPHFHQRWRPEQLQELERLVQQVRVWHGEPDALQPGRGRLDTANLEELTEAWIPVVTPFGRAVLIFKNSD